MPLAQRTAGGRGGLGTGTGAGPAVTAVTSTSTYHQYDPQASLLDNDLLPDDDAAADGTVNGISTHRLRRASTSASRWKLSRSKSDAKMSSPSMSISSEEFQALPPSIQRKYFSSEERLAIAQRSAAEKRQRQPSKNSTASNPDTTNTQTLKGSTKRRRTFQKCDTRLQRRSSLPSAWNVDESRVAGNSSNSTIMNNNANTDDASWFDALPEKVKRSQFSRQEIEAIDARKASSKASSTDRPRTSAASKPSFDSFSWDLQPKLRQKPSFHSPKVSVSPSTCSNQSSQSAPQIPTSHSPHSLSVVTDRLGARGSPATHAVPALTLTTPREGQVASGAKRPSIRRPSGLQPLPLPPPVLAPVPFLSQPDASRYMDIVKTLGNGPIGLDVDVFDMDEETTPTQEREAVRLDVTSAPTVWYDEKLDFELEPENDKPSILTANGSADRPRTLSPSISDAASCDTAGPMTPISPAANSPHNFDNAAYRSEPPLPRPVSSGAPHESVSHPPNVTNFSHPQHTAYREPSPRPQPQNRAPRHLIDGFYETQQNEPYSITIHYGKHDPLALEALPVCDDLTGAHGAFAVPDEQHAKNGFRKVLKVIRGH